MFAIQAAINYTEKNIGRRLFWGVIVFVIAVTSVIAYRISNAGLSNITVIDTFELACDINVNESDEITLYRLTVTGCLKTGEAYTEGIPPVAFQSFDLITNGTIESIENLVLFAHINGDAEAVKYDLACAVLEKVGTGRLDKINCLAPRGEVVRGERYKELPQGAESYPLCDEIKRI